MRLADHNNVIGFKDSSEDYERFVRLIQGFAGIPNFWLLQGKENLLRDSLRDGASGFVVSLLHVSPEPFVQLYRAALAGDEGRAQELQARVTGLYHLLIGAFKRRPETSTHFHLLNAVLRRRGVCENIVLEHEGDAPDWLEAEMEKAIRIAEA